MKKKSKILIAILVIIAVLACAGVGVAVYFQNNYGDSDYLDDVEIATTPYEKDIEVDRDKDEPQDVDTTPIKVSLSDKSLTDFNEYLSNINVDYDFEKIYNLESVEKNLSRIHSDVNEHTYDIRVGDEFDGNEFYKIVKENNKKYLKQKKALDENDWYEEYSNLQLKKICNEMMAGVTEIAEKYDFVDTDMLSCYLSQLAILKCNKGLNMDFAGFAIDHRFYINYDNIKDGGFGLDSDDPMKTTLFHEYMHAFQYGCPDIENGNLYRLGTFEDSDDYHEINPLACYWILEASAEMNMSEYLGVGNSTYQSFIGYVNTINLVNSIGSGKHSRLERASFTHNPEAIFNEFNISNENEKMEIIKALYSIELVQHPSGDFKSLYEEEFGADIISDEAEESYFMLKIKEDYMLTLTKLFYKNLAQQVNSGKASLQDVYYLMRVWEADLDRHFSNVYSIAYMEFFHEFYDKYLEIQKEFYETLAEDSNLDCDKIMEDFESYSLVAKDKAPNCDLEFLDNDAKDYIFGFVDSFYKKGLISIKKCQQKTKEYDSQYPISVLDEHKEYLISD